MSELVLTLRQPAQVGDRARSDFVLGTYDYLPGTVVRGAFAAAWIAAHGEPSAGSARRQEFLGLFEGGVRFGALFSGGEFTPLSVVGHKYQASPDCPAAEYDRAMTEDVPTQCPHCRSPLEHPKGLRGTAPSQQRRTSVAITSSGVARRGQIVTRDTLAAGQAFRGTLIAADPASLGILGGLGPVRVGGRRTTHGAAEVAIEEASPPPTAQRRDDRRLIVRLRGPGIFVDDHGRPARDPNPGELADILGCPARVVSRWTRWHTTAGWHIASGLPKPAELAVAPGSTYLIETDTRITGDALAALGRRGLGLRRHEGFGDLAPPPALTPSRQEREQENQRRHRLLDSIAPLRGLQVTRRDSWQLLLGQLTAHAAGDAAATRFLRGLAGKLDPPAAHALTTYLDMAAADAAYVAGELTSP